MYADAEKHQNLVLMRHLRNRQKTEIRDDKDASCRTGLLLAERAAQITEEAAKRRKIAMDAAKEDAVYLEERRTQRAIAEKIASDAKLKFLQETEAARRAKEVRQRADDLNMAYQRWLQLEFPKELAERCVAIRCGPGPTKWT